MTEPENNDRSPQRLLASVEPFFEKAMATAAADENVVWELTTVTMPQGPNQFATAIGLYAQMPGAIMGSTLHNTLLLAPFNVTQDAADEVCRALVEALHEGRSNQLKEMAEAKPGQPSGLIVP